MTSDIKLNKLIILFAFSQMEVPMKESIIQNMMVENNWISFMDFKQAFFELIKSNQLVSLPTKGADPLYKITVECSDGLSYFYTNIPSSLRNEISSHIKKNRLYYRKKQEYISDYYKNADGTYTVSLKIESAAFTLMDLKITVQSKSKAKWIYENWPDKAAIIYEHIHETLIE